MMYILGLMSGTSLDGMDAALVKVENSGLDTKVELLGFDTFPFPSDIKEEIENAISLEQSHSLLICSLNFKLGHLFADAVKKLCSQLRFPLKKLDLIGSHGQTIYHQPFRSGSFVPSTLQIGEPSVIAYETQTCVISNFRTMDMAAGGQGAPLVPYTEYILYRSTTKHRLLQNIGGIANVTVLPKNASLEEVYAFDTGPGNMVIDEVCRQLFGISYDKNGALAAAGSVNEEMLNYCMSHPFISQAPPKSTGREAFGKEWTSRLIEKFSHLSKHDILTSVTMYTSTSIVENYRTFIFPRVKADEVILGGGGTYNKTLVTMLTDLLKEDCTVLTQDDFGFSSDAKEAIAFAVLANETVHGHTGNVPHATGAKEPVILGNITLPKPTNFSQLIQNRR